MSSPVVICTPAEYLRLERAAEWKHEYRDGQMLAMPSVNRWHSLINGNLAFNLHDQLRNTRCEVLMSRMRVKVVRTGLYTYPDIVVACGEILVEDDQDDTLLNPIVLIEVLSPSTEAYDRGEKFAHYRRLDSLQEYVLVAQDRVRVERYVRQGEEWVLSELSALDDVLSLTAINCQVSLREIYARVVLPSDDLGDG